MRNFALMLCLSLAGSTAHAGLVLMDFGQAPQQDLTNTFDYSFGPAGTARSYDADNLIIDSTYNNTFDVSGTGIGGDFSGVGSFVGEALPTQLLTEPLLFEGSLTRNGGGSTFDADNNLFDFKIVLLPPSGPGLEYSFINQADDTSGVDPGDGVAAVTGLWTGTLIAGAPPPGFIVDQVQFILQAGDTTGTSVLRVDNLQVVPEPASLATAIFGAGALAATRRRRGLAG